MTGKPLNACPECGCTDVEVSAWVHANTNELSESEGPTDQAWCPQCEASGLESVCATRFLDLVDDPKPFKEVTQ